jgi:hypothetical protein
MKRLIFTAAMIAISAPAYAQQYDDPAVAVCEFMMLGGQVAPPGYQRTNTSIDGSTVSIDYEVQVLNIAPRQATYACTFSVSEDGKFSIDRPRNPEADLCSDGHEARLATFQASPDGSEEKYLARAEIERCQSIMQAELEDMRRVISDVLCRWPKWG